MIIRQAQIEEFEKTALQTFENEMVAHLADFSPPLFRVIKEEGMRRATRAGIEQAEKYGFTFQGPIRLYLEMMLLFGSHFDTDPQYPWAGEILKNGGSPTQMTRADQLYQKTLEYQKEVSGPEAKNTKQALKELLALAQNPLPAFPSNNVHAGIRQEMKRIFPQKIEYIGEDGLNKLLEESNKVVRKHNFTTDRAEVLMASLMFAFGHGCINDPLYPWIERTLSDEKIVGPAARAERLEKKAVTWLSHVVAGNEGEQPA